MFPIRGSDALQVVAVLAPLVEVDASASERDRQLAHPIVEALTRAGLFRLLIPCDLGGGGADLKTLSEVVEAMAWIDGATGWCLMIGGCYGAFSGYLLAEGATEILGADPGVITAGQLRPTGEARATGGGYHVSSRWAFGSGCQHSSWMLGGCRILDEDCPRLRPDGTQMTRITFFPKVACNILDTWDSAGLRGTGSHDYEPRPFSARAPPPVVSRTIGTTRTAVYAARHGAIRGVSRSRAHLASLVTLST